VPITVDWDNPQQTIIRAVFNGKWDADDLHRMISDGRDMIKTVLHPVDCIFDFTHSTSSPTSALAIVQGLDVWRVQNERLVIIVNANGYIRTLCNIGRKLAPMTFEHLVFVDRLTDAYHAISKQVAVPMTNLV
jgi:hypothetical protein